MYKIILLPLLLTVSLLAQTFNVSTTPELRTALTNAATNGEDDTIVLADGTYKTTDDGEGTFIYFSNEASSLTLIGSSRENVVLSGDHQHQIFNHSSTLDAPLTLEKLSFVDGNSTTSGGGVFADYSIKVVDCNFMNNSASVGGGFYSMSSSIVTNSNFLSNTSKTGGGFYSIKSTLVENSFFEYNVAINNGNQVSAYGGGFYISTNGAIINGTITVKNSKFNSNTASTTGTYSSSGGGGFFGSNNYGSTEVVNSQFINNTTLGMGGGLYNASNKGKFSVLNSKFVNNSSFSGGGVYSYGSGETTIFNTTFVENNATNGGALYPSQLFSAVNTLLQSNSSGIFLGAGDKNYIYNSIFINNNTNITSYYNGQDIIVELKNNYIDENIVFAGIFSSNNIFDGVTLGFVDEANGDYNLTATSDLIDAGTIAITGLTVPMTDLNGNARIVGAGIDIGPYEYQATEPNIPTNVIASDGTLESIVGVSWSAVANADYYNIYRSESQNETGDIVGISESTSFVDNAIVENTKYYYRINACNGIGCSDYSVADSGYIGQVVTPINPAIIMYLLN